MASVTLNNEKVILIFTSRLARQLLKLGFTIVDIKPDKYDPARTVFAFREEGNIRELMMESLNKKP